MRIQNKNLQKIAVSNELEYKKLKNLIEAQYKFSLRLSENIISVDGEHNASNNSLVILFNDSDCKSCLSDVMIEIEALKQQVISLNVVLVIISNSDSKSNLIKQYDSLQYDQLFIINESQIDVPNTPIIGVLDEEKIIHDIITYDHFMIVNDDYLKYIKSTIW